MNRVGIKDAASSAPHRHCLCTLQQRATYAPAFSPTYDVTSCVITSLHARSRLTLFAKKPRKPKPKSVMMVAMVDDHDPGPGAQIMIIYTRVTGKDPGFGYGDVYDPVARSWIINVANSQSQSSSTEWMQVGMISTTPPGALACSPGMLASMFPAPSVGCPCSCRHKR